jgi:hypothetical protein
MRSSYRWSTTSSEPRLHSRRAERRVRYAWSIDAALTSVARRSAVDPRIKKWPIARQSDKLKCGVAAVDLSSGRLLGCSSSRRRVEEMLDVQLLPGARFPQVIGVHKESLHHIRLSSHPIDAKARPGWSWLLCLESNRQVLLPPHEPSSSLAFGCLVQFPAASASRASLTPTCFGATHRKLPTSVDVTYDSCRSLRKA